jgi:hypothetical protein
MLTKPHGPARLELLVYDKKRRPYTVRVILGIVRSRREFPTWARAVKYAHGLPHFRDYRIGSLPPGNYVFLI